jgi:hypothetical protein
MITRKFLQGLKFRVMDEDTKQGFYGCNSPVPLIAEFGDKYLVVIDGNYCEIMDVEDLEMVETCDDITTL